MKCSHNAVSYFMLAILMLVFANALSGCAGASEVGNPGNPMPQIPTIEEVGEPSEFELMSLCVSGQASPPIELSKLFDGDIRNIRSQSFSGMTDLDKASVNGITFAPPWAPGMVLIGFDDDTAKLVFSGEYKDWDALNSAFHIKVIDLHSIDYGWALLELNSKTTHPKYIAEQYLNLPGVVHAEPDYYLGDKSNIYPYIPGYEGGALPADTLNESLRYYLFREGGGDCPAGCTENKYWLFSANKDGITYMGYYHIDEYGPAEKPDWWGIAQKAINLYGTY
jgi:hypothetical protein